MEFLTFSSLYELLTAFPTEESCIEYLEKVRWGENARSPFSPLGKVYRCKSGQYKCRDTNRYFTVKTDSIFEGSKLPLRKWMVALYLAATNKKGISSIQLGKHLQVTQRTAWFVLHRIRVAMTNRLLWNYPLRGEVEVDETFVGGKFKSRRRHQYKKANGEPTSPVQDKATVLGMVERKGRVVLMHIPDRVKTTVIPKVTGRIKQGSHILSDEYYRSSDFKGDYSHASVKHSAHQYTNGATHTNTIENVWSNLKRFIYGTHHWTSKHHLQRYLNEFMYRFNMRKNSEGVMMQQLIAQTMSCRLSYKELTGRSPKRHIKKKDPKQPPPTLNWDINEILYPDGPY